MHVEIQVIECQLCAKRVKDERAFMEHLADCHPAIFKAAVHSAMNAVGL